MLKYADTFRADLRALLHSYQKELNNKGRRSEFILNGSQDKPFVNIKVTYDTINGRYWFNVLDGYSRPHATPVDCVSHVVRLSSDSQLPFLMNFLPEVLEDKVKASQRHTNPITNA